MVTRTQRKSLQRQPTMSSPIASIEDDDLVVPPARLLLLIYCQWHVCLRFSICLVSASGNRVSSFSLLSQMHLQCFPHSSINAINWWERMAPAWLEELISKMSRCGSGHTLGGIRICNTPSHQPWVAQKGRLFFFFSEPPYVRLTWLNRSTILSSQKL